MRTMKKIQNNKRRNFGGVILVILLAIFLFSAYKTFLGITYVYKYFKYDHNAWGEIIYVSDYVRSRRPYPDHINIQVNLDEPVDGNSRYSITFKKIKDIKKRKHHIEYKGARALVVYNDFYNSDGDVISKVDIVISVVSAIVFVLESIIFVCIYFIIIKKHGNKG